LTVALISFAGPARAADPAVVTDAIAYLASQQIAGTTPATTGSGGWDSDLTFPFVNSEAVLAIAESAQNDASWSTSEALAAVKATTNADDVDPTDVLAIMAANATTPGTAGKFVVLVAKPLGMSTTALAATIGDPNPNGSFATDDLFNNTLYAGLAKHLLEGSVPASTIGYIEDKQLSTGGWSDGFNPDADVDTSSLALQVLIAGGVAPTDPIVQRALAYIADQQNADGTWSAFGNESAESSSRAVLAITAAGFDPNSRCWRDTVEPAAAGDPFVGGDAALESLVNPDGSIAGPGVFSAAFATAQGIQGLERNWLPIVQSTPQTCATVAPPATPPASPPASPTTPVPVASVAATAVQAVPAFTG
jgi:Prenyltransferase and squalene oxidase repeat